MPTQTASLNFQFTAQGQSLATQALAGKIQIDFTKAVSSSTNHFGDTAAQAAQLTDLDNKQQTVTVTEVDAIDGDQSSVKIPVVFNKSDIDTDYQLLTIGLYAKPADGDEVLYAECALQDPVYMHKTSNSSTYSIDLFVIVGTSANVTLKVDPAGVVSHADLTAALKDYATTAYVDGKISTIPKPDMSKYQTPILTAADGTAKLVIAAADDTDAKLKAVIGTKDQGKLSIDIAAKNNPTGHSLSGWFFNDFDGVVNGYGMTSDGTMWRFANNGTATDWKQVPNADDVDAKIATAKQGAIDQADTDTDTKLAKLPQFWNGTQAEFDAIATKDPNTYYYIYDE